MHKKKTKTIWSVDESLLDLPTQFFGNQEKIKVRKQFGFFKVEEQIKGNLDVLSPDEK